MLKLGSTDEIALEIFLGFRSSNILRTPSEGCLHTYLTVIFLAGIVTQGQFGGHSIQALVAMVVCLRSVLMFAELTRGVCYLTLLSAMAFTWRKSG